MNEIKLPCATHFDLDCIQLNHGSFGKAPRSIVDQRAQQIAATERCADQHFRRNLPDQWHHQLRVLSPLVHASVDSLAFVGNATSGVQVGLRTAIRRAAKADKQCLIFKYSSVYHACEMQVVFFEQEFAHVQVCDIELPSTHGLQQTEAEFVQHTKQCITEKLGDDNCHYVLLLDHISAGNAVVNPIAELGDFCRENGVLTIIDGAHAIGNTPIDIDSMKIDFYTSNLHKWLFVPRSCAFIWCSPQLQEFCYPPIISHHHFSASFTTRFMVQGTRDDSNWQMVEAAKQFMDRCGGMDAIMQYNQTLAKEATKLFEEAGIKPVFDMKRHASMVLYRLPDSIAKQAIELIGDGDQLTADHAHGVFSFLYRGHNIVCPVFDYHGHLHMRVSFQIYNDLNEVKLLIAALSDLSTDRYGKPFQLVLKPVAFWEW